jgi:hypothetical protein
MAVQPTPPLCSILCEPQCLLHKTFDQEVTALWFLLQMEILLTALVLRLLRLFPKPTRQLLISEPRMTLCLSFCESGSTTSPNSWWTKPTTFTTLRFPLWVTCWNKTFCALISQRAHQQHLPCRHPFPLRQLRSSLPFLQLHVTTAR